MKKRLLKNLLALIILFVGYDYGSAKKTYELYVGDDILLVAPSPPQGAIFQTAWAGVHKALRVTKDGTYGARVEVTEYFSGIAQVRCDYYWYYYLNNRQYTRHATTYFDIRCKQVNVRLDKESLSLEKGSGEYLKPIFSPSNFYPQPTVTWHSSNPNVASVNYSGYVKGGSPGNAVITVTTNHGTSAKCYVTVRDSTPPPPPPTPPSGGNNDNDNDDNNNDNDNGADDGGSDNDYGGDDSGNEEGDDEEDQSKQYLEMILDKARKRIRGLKVKLVEFI